MNMVLHVATTSTLSITNALKIAYKIVVFAIDCCRNDIETVFEFINRPAQEACSGITLATHPYLYGMQVGLSIFTRENTIGFILRKQVIIFFRNSPINGLLYWRQEKINSHEVHMDAKASPHVTRLNKWATRSALTPQANIALFGHKLKRFKK